MVQTLDDTDTESFRTSVRAWLAANAERRPEGDDTGLDLQDEQLQRLQRDPEGVVREAKRFQAAFHDAGFAGLTWPTEFGGHGKDPEWQGIVAEECAAYEMPDHIFGVGVGICGPTLMARGRDELKQRYLSKILRGEEIWCQLFSEPGAGSDLAGLRTRAVRDGDDWIVSGQKVWTSGAQYADFGLLLARTDVEVPKHRGITMFVCPMSAPGITVRPLRQMTGLTRFNEVFLDEVRVPNANVIGDVNDGWSVAMTTLMYERGGRGGGGSRRRASIDDILVSLAQDTGVAADPVVRDRLARVHVRQFVLARLRERVAAGQCQGADPGSAGSLVKLATSGVVQGAAELGYALGARGGAAWELDNDSAARWSQQLLQSRMSSIAGGTDEVQRNIIGERLLGLPREPGNDARVPFNQRLQ